MPEINIRPLGIQAQLEAQGYKFPNTPAKSQVDLDRFANELDKDYSRRISNRTAERADSTREHPRGLHGRLGRNVLLGIATTAAVLTPQGREAVGATANAAVERLDTYFNGSANNRENETGLPENPSDMKVIVAPEQTSQA